MRHLLLVVGAFVLMEPVIYLSHRFVFHGPGRRIHNSHHRLDRQGFELNDLYPLAFATVTMLGMAAGASRPSLRPLLLVGTGVTLYGAAYLFVHDIYIHRRLALVSARVAVLERLKAAHRIHHLYGGEPYGMLFPVVPDSLWERAAADDRRRAKRQDPRQLAVL